jgi:hypothetical protein
VRRHGRLSCILIPGRPSNNVIELAIFDIDGPVTDPASRRSSTRILDHARLHQKGYVAYNTGRASAIAHQRSFRRCSTRPAKRHQPEFVSHHVDLRREGGGEVSGTTALADGPIESTRDCRARRPAR